MRSIALLSGLLPILTINVSYVIAASSGHVPACIPYLEGCTSVSSTGRHDPESLFFRATLIPAAAFMTIYWRLNHVWLATIEGRVQRQHRVMLGLGMVGSGLLVVYAVLVGFNGVFYDPLRIGAGGMYLVLTFLAQLMLTRRILYLDRRAHFGVPHWLQRTKQGLCAAMILLGIAVIPFKGLFPDKRTIDNIVEWNFAIVMFVFYLTTYLAWRATCFDASFGVSRPADASSTIDG